MSGKTLKTTGRLTFFSPFTSHGEDYPFVAGGIAAGFPSPAEDFSELKISLDQTLVKNKEATFYARVNGHSMRDAGISDGDILVIDRSLNPTNNKIAVCFIDGEFTVKRVRIQKDGVYLVPENPEFKPFKVTTENKLIIWGIVTYVIKSL
jgi:DNA polymerase V